MGIAPPHPAALSESGRRTEPLTTNHFTALF
jgi:hypothetical protein